MPFALATDEDTAKVLLELSQNNRVHNARRGIYLTI